MSEQKQCKQCNEKFAVTDDDLAFYKKISPTFAGKTFEIPAPTLCPECREMRRLSWRNERHLYKRKCDLCKKEMISVYSLNKPYTVYCQQCWWSDKWDPCSYALEYIPGKFREQFAELYLKVPKIGTSVINSENCDYDANMSECKNCYMVFSSVRDEDCLFGRKIIGCKDVVDSVFALDCEECYEVIYGKNCNRCHFVQYCSGCSDSMFLLDCKGCHDCFMCTNLVNKSYYYYGKPLTREQYELKIKESWSGSHKQLQGLKKEYLEMKKGAARRENENMNCEDCLGENLLDCKNCLYCFDDKGAENCKYVNDSWSVGVRDSMDCYICSGELHYECVSHYNSHSCIFGSMNYQGNSNLIYSVDCYNGCKNLFGCASMKKSANCVLNKNYSQEEYEKVAAQVIEELKKSNNWGEFFPMALSPFGYNESAAMMLYPKTKGESIKIGANWEDQGLHENYSGQFYEPHDNIEEYVKSDEEREKLLTGVLKCEKTGHAYKILSQELSFYIKHRIPVPHYHYFERFDNRSAALNPRKLFKRKCDKCEKDITTTYAPDRLEKVYCESCYQKSVL